MNQQTIDMLTDMKLSAMAAEFAAQLKDSSFNALSFEERFSMADRKSTRLNSSHGDESRMPSSA